MSRSVTVLGSTGSIGRQALDVIAASPGRFSIAGLATGRNVDLICEQTTRLGVRRIAVADQAAARAARFRLGDRVDVLDGPSGTLELASMPVDVVLNGMVSSRGLQPTLAALTSGNQVALANKESLIVGGHLVLDAAKRPDQLIPVDSEHSALAQCLRAGAASEVERLIITASGGPFRGRARAQLEAVTVEQALAHPTWRMGPVITVNSATLANKGLEVIETHLLFAIDYDRIEVVVHPQSVVHGLVEFCDGAVVAQLSPPDMRLPIQLALAWPDRLRHAPVHMDWRRVTELVFEPLDRGTFPMIDLALAAGRGGSTAPAVYNAANEQAVSAFLDGRLAFLDIARVVEAVLEMHVPAGSPDLDGVLATETWARASADKLIAARTR